MSTLYMIALLCVAVVILAVMLDAVVAVSRKPKWGPSQPTLMVVSTSERRGPELPFVGLDRRRPSTTLSATQKAA